MFRRFEGWVVDKFYGGKVVKDVVVACLEQDMLEALISFLSEKAERFQQAQNCLQLGEHSLEGTQIHNEYIKLIEQRLSVPLKLHDKTVEQFFGYCQKIQDAGHAEEIAPFIRIVLAATDYLLFSDIMSDEGKRSYFFVILRGLQNQYRRELSRQEVGEGKRDVSCKTGDKTEANACSSEKSNRK